MNFIWLYKSFLAIFIVSVTVASCGELIQEMPDQDKLIIPVGTSMTSRVLGAREAESTPLEGSWDIWSIKLMNQEVTRLEKVLSLMAFIYGRE